jgi:hypothetical protein
MNTITLASSIMPTKTKLLWWQDQGLSYTASGYGSKIPTSKMVYYESKWRRVYARCYSNCATTFIVSGGKQINIAI